MRKYLVDLFYWHARRSRSAALLMIKTCAHAQRKTTYHIQVRISATGCGSLLFVCACVVRPRAWCRGVSAAAVFYRLASSRANVRSVRACSRSPALFCSSNSHSRSRSRARARTHAHAHARTHTHTHTRTHDRAASNRTKPNLSVYLCRSWVGETSNYTPEIIVYGTRCT